MAVQNRIGDVYEIDLGDGRVGFFQYVCRDSSQLGSAVIAVFEGTFEHSSRPDLTRIASLPIQFHAHVFLKAGYTLGVWKKVGKMPLPPPPDIFFRCSEDIGSPEVTVSNRWYIWRVGEEYQMTGSLPPEHYGAEWGLVFNPFSIRSRMLTGVYENRLPDFERATSSSWLSRLSLQLRRPRREQK
jgi:hypothetical protein